MNKRPFDQALWYAKNLSKTQFVNTDDQEDDSLMTRRSGSDQATLAENDSRGQETLATFVALNFLWLTRATQHKTRRPMVDLTL